jgi:hypothetical protein
MSDRDGRRVQVSCWMSPESAKALKAFIRGLPMEFRSDPRLTEAFLSLSAGATRALDERGEQYNKNADWDSLNLPYVEQALAARQNSVDIARKMFQTALSEVGITNSESKLA